MPPLKPSLDPKKHQPSPYRKDIASFEKAMAPVIAALEPDQSGDDAAIINDPKLQLPGAPMPKSVIRKRLPGGDWRKISEALEDREESHIPTVDETNDLSSLEGIVTEDLQMGNVIVAITLDRDFSTNGFSYKPTLYCFEVIDPNPNRSGSNFCTKKVKEITLDHPASNKSDSILEHSHGEAYIFDPIIAQGLGITFSNPSNPNHQPGTSAVQQLIVFKDRSEMTRFLVKKEVENTSSPALLPPTQNR